MTSGIRWRIFVLQIGLIGILGFVSGFAFWGKQLRDIDRARPARCAADLLPAAGSQAITSLPKADAAAMTQYAGQELLTGQQAQVYANNFINVHLGEIAGGQTYSQLSTAAQADPTNTKLAGEVATIFKGTTLRSMLLNAYGWGQIGQFAGYAAIGLLIATFAVFGAFVFEIFSFVGCEEEGIARPRGVGCPRSRHARSSYLTHSDALPDDPSARCRWVILRCRATAFSAQRISTGAPPKLRTAQATAPIRPASVPSAAVTILQRR